MLESKTIHTIFTHKLEAFLYAYNAAKKGILD